MNTLFKNGFVYRTSEHAFARADLLVQDGMIADTSFTGTPAEDTKVIDCEGLYILPGLVDVHTHGRAGYDFNTADAAQCRIMRRSYAEEGTTTLLATLASATLDSFRASIDTAAANADAEPGLAHIAGVHIEGRYLSPAHRGAHAPELLAPLDAGEIAGLIRRIRPMTAHVSAACEMEGGKDFVRAAIDNGATVSLAHSDATYEQAMEAVSWGVTAFTHTYNAMRPLHHRKPGNAAASLLCDGAYSEFICDGEHIHPAMIELASRLKPADRLVLITDSCEAAGCPDGNYSIAGLPVIVKNGRAVNEEGALAGSTVNLFRCLCNYMSFTHKTLEEALPAATSNPAAMVGLENVCGSIRPGLRADFVMIRDKTAPVKESVWISGEKI